MPLKARLTKDDSVVQATESSAPMQERVGDHEINNDRRRLLLVVSGSMAAAVIARYLPGSGVGLVLKLVAGCYVVLLLPGALTLGALRWKTSLPLAAAGSLVGSLLCVFVALALTFLIHASLSFTIALLGAISLVALSVALLRPQHGENAVNATGLTDRGNRFSQAAVIVLGVLFGVAVSLALPAVMGDGLEHLSRARKLAEFNVLVSVAGIDQYRGAGFDPGYAFPLWHAVLALIARVMRMDVADVIRFLPVVLAPLSLLLLYTAGANLFASWVGGITTVVAEVARMGFSFSAEKRLTGAGWFVYTSWPGQGSILLLVPALLALTLTYVQSGTSKLLVGVAAGGFVLSVVHASYAPFVAIVLLGFLVAHLWLRSSDRTGTKRIAIALGILLLSSALYFVWLLPTLKTATFFQSGGSDRSRVFAHYEDQLDVYNHSSFRLAPEFIASGSGGAVSLVALFAIPTALVSSRRRWSAYVLGGSLAILAIALTPPLFAKFSDFASVSQGRRLVAFFLPWSFAVTGGVLFLSRFKIAAVVAAAAAGFILPVVYPTSWATGSALRGPGWPVWFAVVGGTAALLIGRFFSREEARVASFWPVAIALAFVTPIVFAGLSDLTHRSDERALTPGLVEAVRQNVDQREVVFSTLEASYRIQAYAPVYVAAVPRGHARPTRANAHLQRVSDVARFFSAGTSNSVRRSLLTKYDATWIVVVKGEPYPARFFDPLVPVYEDDRYALYRWHLAQD
jgi:hypothetical protein